MSTSSNHRLNIQVSNHIKTMRMNTTNRWIKDGITSILSGSNNTHNISASRKIEILRTDSPTLECLVSVRTKLYKYLTSVSNSIPISRQTIDAVGETSSSCSTNHENQSIINARAPSSLSQNIITPKKTLATQPLGKITYEKTNTHNGSLKKKCSVEIWLPDAYADNDDGDASPSTSPDPAVIDKISQPISTQNRQSNTNIKTKSSDEGSSKISEPIPIPHINHYQNHLTDQFEKQSCPSQNSSTIKSNKNVKRSQTHHLSSSINHNKKTVEYATTEISVASKNRLPKIKQTYSAHEPAGSVGSGNSTMINVPMRKYPNRKLPRENPHHNAHIKKDSISHASSNHPTVAIKILLGNIPPIRSTSNYHNINTKILTRRSLNHKSPNSNNLPQTNFISIIDHSQHRGTSASRPTFPVPVAAAKRTSDVLHSLQGKIPARLSIQPDSPENVSSSPHCLQRIIHGTEQIPAYISQRSLPHAPPLRFFHSEQEHPVQSFLQYQNSAHTSTTGVSTNKVLVHLKYTTGENTNCNYLLPK